MMLQGQFIREMKMVNSLDIQNLRRSGRMEFLINLFWFPINSIEFIFNLGLWALIAYGIYEAIRI